MASKQIQNVCNYHRDLHWILDGCVSRVICAKIFRLCFKSVNSLMYSQKNAKIFTRHILVNYFSLHFCTIYISGVIQRLRLGKLEIAFRKNAAEQYVGDGSSFHNFHSFEQWSPQNSDAAPEMKKIQGFRNELFTVKMGDHMSLRKAEENPGHTRCKAAFWDALLESARESIDCAAS